MFTPHHRTADKWCIYPTYDYTHCICDSFEDITHSICTLEFFLSRESYYWLIDALELYKPIQSEFGRLNLTNSVTSKRKLNTLVTEGHVSGWDDPRLHTIAGIRRRGFTADAVNAFSREIGVTTNVVTTPFERLENYVREHLNEIAPRHFFLLEPLKVTIENLEAPEKCDLSGKGGDGSRTQMLDRTIYIDAIDFREQEDPNFYRLSPGKSVGLLQVPFPITCTGVIKSATGQVIEVKARYESSIKTKPKTYIQWLNSDSSVKVEARLYSKLFKHQNPQSKDEVPDGWLTDLNPDSLVIVKDAMLESGVVGKPFGYTFQGPRVGYFCVDRDSTDYSIVLNRTVTLKEDSKKSS